MNHLLRFSGAKIETHIRAFEMIKRMEMPPVLTAAILLPQQITKEQVPVGTQVFLVTDSTVTMCS